MADETDKPLKCPFCGRQPSVVKGRRHTRDGLYAKAGDWFYRPAVKCTRCQIGREFESVDEALVWWNTRAG